MTVSETIKEITIQHLKSGGVAIGQCLTAVGFVGGTVPELKEKDGLIELSMDDTCGSGIAVGLACAGKRPIFIVRYQGFQWIDGSPIANYASRSKEMWNIPTPIFVRSIAMEGGIGPVAGSSHHGMFTRMPGISVVAPMTPEEYKSVWQYFMSHDDPIYVSEHRRSFSIDYEMPDIINPIADITLLPISATRLNTLEAIEILSKEGIICNIIHLKWLKPFTVDDELLQALNSSRFGGIVIDTDYENGVSKCIAFDIMQKTHRKIRVMGLEERTAGFAPHLDNLPPSVEKIVKTVEQIVNRS